MKKKAGKSDASEPWYRRVHQELEAHPPECWSVVNGINGAGVFLLPNDGALHEQNCSEQDIPLVGSYRIIFEFFRLSRSGAIKVSARVAGTSGEPLFDRLNSIAQDCLCPLPGRRVARQTQSVAAWPVRHERPVYAVEDHTGMANWLREFLAKPPHDFQRFLKEVESYLVSVRV